ncbi:MAG: methyltransferase domain-containing protein [Sideroxydans sp.]|jgi:SAM-dependent methyltransferase
MTRHLDLGCGTSPRNPYGKPEICGVDVRDDAFILLSQAGIVMRKANLIVDKIPFEDDYFSSVSAFDFLEHVPRQICMGSSNEIVYPFIELMNEIWRVLSPGGLFLAVTPVYPSPLAFADPTHVNTITEETHKYFCGESPVGGIYGFHGQFRARLAKKSAPSNFIRMPHNPITSFIRDASRHMSGKGLHHMVWELEAVK